MLFRTVILVAVTHNVERSLVVGCGNIDEEVQARVGRDVGGQLVLHRIDGQAEVTLRDRLSAALGLLLQSRD